jgi:cyclic dehypoxanthinyl futalosine synthase
MNSKVDTILDKALEGTRLEQADIQALFDDGGLLELGQAADAVRRQKHPTDIATYIIDRNINYTNVCIYRCRFCAFYRAVKDSDAYVLPFDEIAAKVAETVTCGGTGILLQGGVHPDLRISYYEQLLADLKKAFPQIHLHAFSVPEIWYLAKLEKLPVRDVIERLVVAGLDSIPGGGAEILEDETRRQIWSRAKASTDRVTHLLGIRGLQDDTEGFTAFIPWTFQDTGTDLEGEVEPSGGYDYLRTLAISRLALENIDHVQGSWVTQGPKVGQVSLHFGADDLGSIMLEENVVAAAGAQYRMAQNDMERVIRGAGYEPRQRRTLYEPL